MPDEDAPAFETGVRASAASVESVGYADHNPTETRSVSELTKAGLCQIPLCPFLRSF